MSVSLTDDGGVVMRERIEAALEEIRPMLQADGGDVELVAVEGMQVTVRLVGACEGCSMAATTLKSGIAQRLREVAPEVDVVAV
jgi:Fe-S cluster biogenesis protein NfuA